MARVPRTAARHLIYGTACPVSTTISISSTATHWGLCWHHPKLWGVLPERSDPQPRVPAWPQFMRGCIRYRQSLDAQLADAPRSDKEYDDD
jgi:hypothetical protein